MITRRTMVQSVLFGVAATVLAAWVISTRALDTTAAGVSALDGARQKHVTRYDRIGSTDVRCLATDAPTWGLRADVSNPDDLVPAWMRPSLVPWGWEVGPPANSYSVRTVKISGWPLPCLYAVYEAVPSPGVWPHRAMSGLVISDSWTGFGVRWPGEMPVALPYRPRAGPFVANVVFYAVVFAGVSWMVGSVRRGRRRRRGRCEQCGYDLRGLAPDSTCPECGKAEAMRRAHAS